MASTTLSTGQRTPTTFRGFEPLTANYVYCPNQFFDVCLPNSSRGTVRLVAYFIRRILGWHDAHGNPIEQNVSVTYREITEEAGVSRRAIRESIDDAIAGGFIRCLQSGRPKSKGCPARTASYTLRWDADGEYITAPKAFKGFFRRKGHRSPIPNAFFDEIVPRERLAVVKVVGTVLRYTIGYENQFGIGRRAQAPLSYSHMQKFSGLRHRPSLATALRRAKEEGYISCVSQGCFDRNAGIDSRPATYAPKWLEQAAVQMIGAETEPGSSDRSKNRTGNGAESEPENRGKNRTDIKTDNKDTSKQQQSSRGVMPSAAADVSKLIQLLRDEGFDEKAARDLAIVSSFDELQNQIAWIDLRKPTNRLGMLRTAIEQKWAEPIGVKEGEAKKRRRDWEQEQDSIQAANDAALADEVRGQKENRRALLGDWRDRTTEERTQFHSDAIAEAKSNFDRVQLRRHTSLDDPPMATLEVMARALGIAKVS